MYLKTCFVNTASNNTMLLKTYYIKEKQSKSATYCSYWTQNCGMPVSVPHLPLHSEVCLASQLAEWYQFYCIHILMTTLFNPVSGVKKELVNAFYWAFSNFNSNLSHRKFLLAFNMQQQRATRYDENLLGKCHYLIVLFLYSSLWISYWTTATSC